MTGPTGATDREDESHGAVRDPDLRGRGRIRRGWPGALRQGDGGAHEVRGRDRRRDHGGQALQPTTTATSIRSDGNGGATVTDGPFAETKEALGGFYLIEAPDLDAAIAIAKTVPAALGGVEVRPVMVFD